MQTKVVIWLGLKKNLSDTTFAFLHGVLERKDAEAWAQHTIRAPELKFILDALALLFLRKYLYRIWIVQEILSARETMVYYGSNSICLDDFLRATEFMLKQCEVDGGAHVTSVTFARIILTEGLRGIERSRGLFIHGLPDLFDMLKTFKSTISTDPGDKVYGIIGLTKCTG
jgi:hypothetical protein